MAELRALIESSDLDGLVRHADGLAASRNWTGLVMMRDMCLEASERGKQVWGAGHFAEYRLALEAPAEYAIAVIKPGGGRFGNGPLWEVAASTHTWSELRMVNDNISRTFIAHERSIRGDDLGSLELDRSLVDAPLRLAQWEPEYPTATYLADRADFPEHEVLMPDTWVDLPHDQPREGEDDVTDALMALVHPWVDQSNGRSEAVAVAGTAHEAVRALGPRRVRLSEVPFKSAMGAMTWTGASGGAYGRRRGTPVGRALAWWTLACATGLDRNWPATSDDLGEAGAKLQWFAWDLGDSTEGWQFHLAIHDPAEGLAWAVAAIDAT